MPFEPLVPRFVEKVWGASKLSPWFPDVPEKIGEVWLEHSSGRPLPLLLKFLFTSERLSVQVHPPDDYARIHHQSPGKTEMWHILRAEPGARIALGLERTLTSEELREASESGAIEDLLTWIPVRPGETYFVPAGTIHAIGEGIALCEIQQQSDVTYRLYDYGRPRELHLEHGVRVASPHPFNPALPVVADPETLVESEYFRTELWEVEAEREIPGVAGRPSWLICIAGTGWLEHCGERLPFRAGGAWQVLEREAPVEVRATSSGARFLRTFVPRPERG